MPEVDVMPKQEDEEKLADIFLFLVPVQRLIALELRPRIKQNFVRAVIMAQLVERLPLTTEICTSIQILAIFGHFANIYC